MRELLFILPTYNHFEYAELCFNSFARYTPIDRSHVLIVDDASSKFNLSKVFDWNACSKSIMRFKQRAGLTRSWNEGLRFARAHNYNYTICGNSDLLFTKNWYTPLKNALNNDYDLVGPVTNAPGHSPWQNINNFINFEPTDDLEILNNCVDKLKSFKIPQYVNFINGFFLMAKTSTWWDKPFDSENVFNLKYRLVGNETELQNRWKLYNRRIGFVPSSFVFHYRSVSRPEALIQAASKGWYRNDNSHLHTV